MNQALWGIDLGGTKIEGVVLESIDHSSVLVRTRLDTEGTKGYEHIIGQIVKLVATMEKESGSRPHAIGIGTPGVLDPRLQTMKNSNSTALNGMPLQKDLEAALKIPVVLANDANCFALAETHWGAVKQVVPRAGMVFGVIMGTGVGGGIVIDGKIWGGHHGIGGEWGHNYLDASGGACYCGKTGCVETVIAGPALERYYKSLTGQAVKLKEIAARHRQGTDPAATETIQRLIHFFGLAISSVVNLLDPDAIVIGGGVGNLGEIYTEGREALGKFIFNNRVELSILKPSLGDSAGVFGAAALVAP